MRILRILAPNPGPYTLQGTNTWVVGTGPALVIDPGPPDALHLREVARSAGEVGAILLTHHHPDHAPGADELAGLTGAPVLACQPTGAQRPLENGMVVRAGGAALEVVATPGHTWDHAVFHDSQSGAMFTGDAVLGRGTSVIDPPDGDMAEYLRSLRNMLALRPSVLYPGHGPTVWDGVAKLQEYLAHREERERQVLEGLREGPRTPEDLAPLVYPDYPMELHPAAARSLLAHLLKLERDGLVVGVDADAGARARFALAEGEAPGSGTT